MSLRRQTLLAAAAALCCLAAAPATLPTLEEALASKHDLYAEAAIARPEGPTFEFFKDLLPPLRYCDAPFRCYPIVLSAPGSTVKARLVSDGSAVNALGRMPKWRTETGTPVTFHLGPDLEVFGQDLSRLAGPKYAEGYLPIVQSSYAHSGADYHQEVFAPTDPALAKHGVVLCKFTVTKGTRAKLEAWVENTNPQEMEVIRDAEGDTVAGSISAESGVFRRDRKVVALYDKTWEFSPARSTLTTYLSPGEAAYLAVYTTPPAADAKLPTPLTADVYDEHRRQCADTWKQVVTSGMTIEVPEPYVNDAWRSTLIGMRMLVHGDQMRYSAGNQYAGLYVGEGGDAARTLAMYKHTDTARSVMPSLFRFSRKDLIYHQAGKKLQMLAHYYQLTRDRSAIEEFRPLWKKEVNVILDGLKSNEGMVPAERYAGDLAGQVPSLNSNAACWRALRDWAVILLELGDEPRAAQLASAAANLRRLTLAKLEQALDRSTTPPFMPVNLSGTEKPFSPITETSPGSYWNIMAQYVLGAGVFPYNSKYADDLITYRRTHGGEMFGLNRSSLRPHHWPTTGAAGINDLYGMRSGHVNFLRDDIDHAIATFYGKLAHGLTRDTFIGAEGSSIVPDDRFGRTMTLPPNSTSNAFFLWHLRHMLVQDFDLDDDGRPESLRLCFATPRQWLKDGPIRVHNAPTAFGAVSFTVVPSKDEVTATLQLPAAPKTFLRLRLPKNRRVNSATANDKPVKVVGDTVDLTGLSGDVRVRAVVDGAG